jgi:hypothetical protein
MDYVSAFAKRGAINLLSNVGPAWIPEQGINGHQFLRALEQNFAITLEKLIIEPNAYYLRFVFPERYLFG